MQFFPQKKAFFVVAIFEVNWALRLLVVEPLTRLFIGAQGQQQLGDTAGVMEMDEMDQEMDEMGQILTRKPSEKHEKNHRFCMF